MENVLLSFTGKRFNLVCAYADRQKARAAGFLWSEPDKIHYTTHHRVASRLRQYSEKSAENEFKRVLLNVKPWAGAIQIPDNREAKPFQIDAARFALGRNRAYLALDPRLGKLITSILVDNTEPLPTVFVCPPFLAYNTAEKFRAWSTSPNLKIHVYGTYDLAPKDTDILIMPDSRLARPVAFEAVRRFIKDRPARLVVDEMHRYNSQESNRAASLLGMRGHPGYLRFFSHAVFLSGTPMRNRPSELYPVLSACAPETIDHMSYDEYAEKFCARKPGYKTWDDSGAANMADLKARVFDKFMLRIKKADVLKDLPAKTEEIVFIGQDVAPRVALMEKEILAKYSPEDILAHIAPNGQIATYRKELGILKTRLVLEYMKGLLEFTDENIILFAYHREVVKLLSEGLAEYKPFVVTGGTPMEVRQQYVKEFQADKTRRLFIGNIDALGVGNDLFKADRVVFAEFSYVPSDNDQAADRMFNMTDGENVFCQYLVFTNSLDRKICEINLRKRATTQHL